MDNEGFTAVYVTILIMAFVAVWLMMATPAPEKLWPLAVWTITIYLCGVGLGVALWKKK